MELSSEHSFTATLPVYGHIALFLPSLAGGGAERILINLAAGFAERGYKVDLVLATAVGKYLDYVSSSVRVVDLGASRPVMAIPALARYLHRERPHALLSTITNANIAALWAMLLSKVSCRCVVREASTLSVELAHSSVINRYLLPPLMQRLFSYAHAIIAPSHGVADDLMSVIGIPRKSIHVIYNPVVSASMLAKSREPVAHCWLQDDDLPVIIGMGRLTQQKDFTTLIRAFALLRKKVRSRLIILGDGEERASLDVLCRRLNIADDVDLVGFVANPYAYLSRAAVFVLSSLWEGLPGVLIEALVCGAQVVATDCPSGPREILDNGIYGQLVPVRDTVAMANAIARALNGDFVAADPTEWIKLFSVDSNTDRYLKLLVG